MSVKNLAGLLCALALLCSFCLPVFADNNDNTVKITTTVPTTHTITVDRVDGAAVFFNGQSGTNFTVDRFDRLQLLICPDSGRVLTRVLVNGEDVTALVQGGYYTLPAACEDLTLQVETTAAPQAASPASTPAPAESAARPAKTPAPAKPEATPTETPQPTTPTETPAPAAPEAAPTETPQPTAPAVTPAPQTAGVTPLVWLIPLVLFIIVLLVLLRRKKGKK